MLFLMTACSSPKISDVKIKIIKNNKQNYQKVVRSEVLIETKNFNNFNILKEKFYNNVLISYYDEDNNIVAKETVSSIEEAIEKSKNNQTLIKNDGVGSEITYKAHLNNNKTENRTINQPFIAEFNKDKISTERDLLNHIQTHKPDDKLTWSGKKVKKIDLIKINYKKYFTEKEYKHIHQTNKKGDEWKWVKVHKIRTTQYLYSYENSELKKLSETYSEIDS